MKKFIPYIFPIIALIIVIVLAFNWYSNRTQEEIPTPPVSAGAEIEELSVSELEALDALGRGLGNFQTLDLIGQGGLGEVRYEKRDNQVFFTVVANLLAPDSGNYQLFIKPAGAADFIASEHFTFGKAGYLAGTVLDLTQLPVEIQVRLADQVVLEGTLQ